jgi:hypothetical protein
LVELGRARFAVVALLQRIVEFATDQEQRGLRSPVDRQRFRAVAEREFQLAASGRNDAECQARVGVAHR